MDGLSPKAKQSERSQWVNWLKAAAVIAVLYLFLVSIGMIGTAFKGMGREMAETLLQSAAGPVIGLVIGILATSIIQSSSTTTSLVVGMVAAGTFGSDPKLAVAAAVPIIMGANIGTSITNTIVSLGHITHKQEFQRAFSASIVHDFFNFFAVIILFPLEVYTGIISKSANLLTNLFIGTGSITFQSPVKAATKPAVHFMEELMGLQEIINPNVILAIVAVLLLFFSLRSLTKLIRSLVITRLETFFDTHIFKTDLRAILFGIAITIMVQSSSITTSLVIPLAGAGILTLRQIFPYTLGSNIGTTFTALLASLATGSHAPLAVAFAHLLFNIFGIGIIWPIPALRRLPIKFAKWFSAITVKNRAYPIIYVIVAFFIIPLMLIVILR
ncbi:MAG: Na/Pi symporter [Candidatus Marinimicrobia bacterium]|nr:Na/Pi symporter [Candidatus Neomarinimicrobiota bacterium]MCF7829198.1 Na/Pi symporter [Candidatus Neomarinimicrobiota bacterium]MCF7881149.1 Na/Pi symporter [Candidatus Neomarinimicrobiota bacterium]